MNELNFLMKFFQYNVTTQEPSIKQDILALYKKALTRIKDSYMTLKRSIDYWNQTIELNKMNKDFKIYQDRLMCYESFYETFIMNHLKKGLSTTSNIHRKSICLELIVFMSDIVPASLWNNCWRTDDTALLSDLFDDPYESMLVLALKLMNILSNRGYQHKVCYHMIIIKLTKKISTHYNL